MEFNLIVSQDEVKKIIKLLNTKFKQFNYEIIDTEEDNRILKVYSNSNKDIDEISEFYEVLFEEFESAKIIEKNSMEV